MSDDIVPRSILLVCLLLCAGFFAGTETALSYHNRIRMQVLADDGDKRAKRVVDIAEHFDRAIVTLLIALNIIYIASASVSTLLAVELMGDAGSIVATVLTTLAVFLFCETIPKNIARANSDAFIRAVSLPLQAFMLLLKPVALLLTWLGDVVKRRLRGQGQSEPTVTEDEFASIVEDAQEDGVINPEESDIIKSAIEFGDIKACDVMTRREDMVAIDADMPIARLKQWLLDYKFSRFPVYEGDINHIIGVARSVRCLWRILNSADFDIRENITRPYFVQSDALISRVFEGMSVKRTHFAVVQGGAGETLGILTMEDILEEIVGEIYDEDDAAPAAPKAARPLPEGARREAKTP